MKEAVILGAYTDTIEKEWSLIKTILDWKKHNIPIILSTHYPVSEKIQNLVDYYIFDKEQYMEEKLMVSQWYRCESFQITAKANRPYHAAAALIAFQNAIRSIGDKFDFIYLQDYDVDLNKQELFNIVRPLQSSNYELFVFNWKGDVRGYAATVIFFKQGAFNKIWGDLQSVDDYLNLVYSVNKNNIFGEALAKDIVDMKDLHEIVYLFDENQTNAILGNFSEHSADINEPRIYLSTTSIDGAILFLVNPTQTSTLFKIQTQNLITGQQEEHFQELNSGTGMFWKLFNIHTHLKVSCGNMKKEYYINQFNIFKECIFEFYDGTQIFMKT